MFLPLTEVKDLKSDNFLLGFEDPTVLESYVRQQESDPAPYKLSDGRPIYESRADFGPLRKGVGLVKISDFSAAVFGNVTTAHNHDIQPQQLCAPEVLLKATWTYSADIWNLGTMVRTLEGREAFLHNATNRFSPSCGNYLRMPPFLMG
jgi:serine/threonine-protein kinase SRPK3